MTDTSAAHQEQALVNSNSNDKMAAVTNDSADGSPNGASSRPKTAAMPPIPSLQSQSIGTKPTLVEKAPMRFLIMDAPRQANLPYYIREMKKNNVTHVVRVCEPTYVAGAELSNAGITIHEMEYKDGTSPPKELIERWLNLVESTFYTSRNATPADASSGPCIAVHCVAGLGRAPQLVAIALIEFARMDPVEVVTYLRSKRRGSINEKQLLYLSQYKKMKSSHGVDSACACVIL